MIYGYGATIDDAKRDAKRKAQRAGLWPAQEDHEEIP
jgi:hypothetical protein